MSRRQSIKYLLLSNNVNQNELNLLTFSTIKTHWNCFRFFFVYFATNYFQVTNETSNYKQNMESEKEEKEKNI